MPKVSAGRKTKGREPRRVPVALEPAEPADLLKRAIALTPDPDGVDPCISDRQFAIQVLGNNERTLRRYLARRRKIPGAVLAIARAIVEAKVPGSSAEPAPAE